MGIVCLSRKGGGGLGDCACLGSSGVYGCGGGVWCLHGRTAGTRNAAKAQGGKKNWLSSEEPGKETKAEEKKGKKNDSRPLPMSLRGCLAEYEGGSGRLAGLGMGWDASSASRTASSSRNVNSTAGPDSVNYDALWPWKERGARALVRWDVLDASLFLSLSLSLFAHASAGRRAPKCLGTRTRPDQARSGTQHQRITRKCGRRPGAAPTAAENYRLNVVAQYCISH